MHPITPSQYLSKTNHLVTPEALALFSDTYLFAQDYAVASTYVHHHEWGSGGYSRHVVQLLRDDRPLLVSVRYLRWDTLSDDSEDYTLDNIKATYLLVDEPDVHKIFEAIQQIQAAPLPA